MAKIATREAYGKALVEFGANPDIVVMDADLSKSTYTNLFKKAYPDLDMVSIGPTIKGAHSPEERVSIPSVERFWQLLTATLAAIPTEEQTLN